MGFKDIRQRVIDALNSGNYLNEPRTTLTSDGKSPNLLHDGEVDEVFLVSALCKCRNSMYKEDPHHEYGYLGCNVHIFQPTYDNKEWYIKVYFLSDIGPLEEGGVDVMFISVHPSVHGV